jgi:DNA-binding MarR family transcriptional regulator
MFLRRDVGVSGGINTVSDDEKREIVHKVLGQLYEDWAHNQGRSLNALKKEEQWDKSNFDSVIARLRDSGLIEKGDLTPDGVEYVEANEIASKSEIERHNDLRTKALGFLDNLYQTDGGSAHASVEEIAHGCGLNGSDLFVDLRLLRLRGHLENIGGTRYRMTDNGRRYYHGADYEDII